MAKITKHHGKKRGPKKGSRHSSKHNNAISEGMKKYWATKGKTRKTKSRKRVKTKSSPHVKRKANKRKIRYKFS